MKRDSKERKVFTIPFPAHWSDERIKRHVDKVFKEQKKKWKKNGNR